VDPNERHLRSDRLRTSHDHHNDQSIAVLTETDPAAWVQLVDLCDRRLHTSMPDLGWDKALEDQAAVRPPGRAVCGTPSGYQRHWRNHESACLACRSAANKANLAAKRLRERDRRSGVCACGQPADGTKNRCAACVLQSNRLSALASMRRTRARRRAERSDMVVTAAVPAEITADIPAAPQAS
jgi:hypothetical protein